MGYKRTINMWYHCAGVAGSGSKQYDVSNDLQSSNVVMVVAAATELGRYQ